MRVRQEGWSPFEVNIHSLRCSDLAKRKISVLELGTVLNERYRLDHKIVSTGFSDIYRGTKLTTNQTVAIKVLRLGEIPKNDRKEMQERFRREISAYSKLAHPNLVRLVDTGVYENALVYLVLEYISGETLAIRLWRDGALGPFLAKHLMMQCLDALSAAHGQGIVHRDFKPHNIMVTGTGGQPNAVVLDLGLAGATDDWLSMAGDRITQPNHVPGSVAYMAPEQIKGEVTPASDIYAWGLVYLECLTGSPVFTGSSNYEIVMKHMNETVQIPEPLASHPLGQILRRATAKSTSVRYRLATEALSDLRRCGMSELNTARMTSKGIARPDKGHTTTRIDKEVLTKLARDSE